MSRDYRVPRGIAAWLLVYVLAVLAVYGARELLEYERVRVEAERVMRGIPVVERMK